HLGAGDKLSSMSEEYTLALEERAATALRQIAVSRKHRFQVTTLSYGRDRPIASDSTPYPVSKDDVNAWNRIAALHNRVEMCLIPRGTNVLQISRRTCPAPV